MWNEERTTPREAHIHLYTAPNVLLRAYSSVDCALAIRAGIWSGMRDSNPYHHLGGVRCYHYTNSAWWAVNLSPYGTSVL